MKGKMLFEKVLWDIDKIAGNTISIDKTSYKFDPDSLTVLEDDGGFTLDAFVYNYFDDIAGIAINFKCEADVKEVWVLYSTAQASDSSQTVFYKEAKDELIELLKGTKYIEYFVCKENGLLWTDSGFYDIDDYIDEVKDYLNAVLFMYNPPKKIPFGGYALFKKVIKRR